jgi:hypothetical protein
MAVIIHTHLNRSNPTETCLTLWFGEGDMQFELDSMPTLAEAAKILFSWGIPVNAMTSYTPAPSAPHYGFALTRWSPTFMCPGPEGGDPEWEWEMSEQIAEVGVLFFPYCLPLSFHLQFSTITPQTPDLISHLNELSMQYPPEPIECTVVRYCEAIVNWRGTPELNVVSTLPLSSFFLPNCESTNKIIAPATMLIPWVAPWFSLFTVQI